jgi:nucleoid-associated protein YgaU
MPSAEVVMKRLLLLGIVAATLVPLACKTGRSGSEMTDELARLENELADLEQTYNRTLEEREDIEAEIENADALYEEARMALARRDSLRAELEALGYSPDGADAYATVAAGEGGQVRREPVVASPEGGSNPQPGREPSFRSGGRYTGPHGVHVVVKGEYLFKIAGYKQYYADGDRWTVIYEANSYQIKDPHWIFVGQRLQIPVL